MKTLGTARHNKNGPWEVLLHGEFAAEFAMWTETVQDAMLAQVVKLRVFGPTLGRPTVDTLKGSSYPNMKELRFDADGGAWRIAFAFDPKRRGILLVGGNKAGVSKERYYSGLIQTADARYGQHLKRIEAEEKR